MARNARSMQCSAPSCWACSLRLSIRTIVATSLPTIVGDSAASTSSPGCHVVPARVDGLHPLYGKLGDLYGRKFLFQAAIVIFIVGSMLAGLSQNMLELIGFRAIQGVGAGGLMVGAQAIIVTSFRPASEASTRDGWAASSRWPASPGR